MPNLASAPPPAPRKPAILIVDDAPENVSVLRTMMLRQEYQTFVATSGERALEIAQRIQPDLVLLDVVMPGMDGLETCRRLKAHPLTARIPVILMSARGELDDIVAGFDTGAADYIPKPLRMEEVCARVRAQLRLNSGSSAQKEQTERLRMIVDSMDQGLLIVERNGRVQYANPACDRYLGYAADELVGRSLAELVAQQDSYPDGCSAMEAIGHGTREVLIRHRDGGLRAMDLTMTPIHAADGQFLALLHDITHHKQSEDALQRAAMLDPLTHIANRRHFDTFLEKEWQRAIRNAQPMSLVVLDVDHFKLYNDTLGHVAGDVCLQKVAQALDAHALRPTDLAARYGGEEFVLLFAETPHEAATRLAEAIRTTVEALQLPNPRSPTSPWITASIGVATIVPTQLDTIEQFFVCADRAMYAAKEGGRNRVETAVAGAAWEAVRNAHCTFG
ncbi:response regulator receiver modulated diguanylate cyclase [Massilia sp. WF1]|uniref:diguanylate cyclase n=1 Tax=unclassified Massilia TaxID=2609279 RepID=UPI000649E579|nr:MULTISPECIES: diguanylate cyclase [unclassified Massilia]ALK98030.1 response regulator receiver modulated diguanylate cyclase [Massilia sp. WG5]KLU35503.1 response regulator receiver modulated diguanylate cyclase [Massilia sp. WF1]